jgi:hypothetical protein
LVSGCALLALTAVDVSNSGRELDGLLPKEIKGYSQIAVDVRCPQITTGFGNAAK